MSGLFTTLNALTTALDAQTQAINITSNNIANVNNPNYSLESPVYEDRGTVNTAEGPQSLGISVTTKQARDAVLDQMVRQEASLTAGFQAQQNVFQQAQASLGENITSTSSSGSASTTTESGLSAALDSFFNAFEGYAADPTNTSTGQALLEQAGVLTDRFQQVDQSLGQVQTGITNQVTSDISSANTLLQQVATLNSQIGSVEVNSPGSAVGMRDQREGYLEQLAGLMPVTVTENSKGEDLVTATSSGSSVTLVNNGTVVGPLSYSSGSVIAGSGSGAHTLTLSSGSIAGNITASTGAVQTLQDSLDALASQIVTSVNTAYNPGSTATGNFFNSAGTAAGTIALDSHLTSSTLHAGVGSAGDNSIALAVAGVANQVFSTGGGAAITGTIDQYYGSVVSSIGQALSTANTQVTDQTNVQTIVNNQRSSVSGVSIDQEMSNLMSYQRAYQASSEVFQVVNTLLSNLVTNLTALSG